MPEERDRIARLESSVDDLRTHSTWHRTRVFEFTDRMARVETNQAHIRKDLAEIKEDVGAIAAKFHVNGKGNGRKRTTLAASITAGGAVIAALVESLRRTVS